MIVKLHQIVTAFQKKLDKEVTKHRQKMRMESLASLIQCRYLFLEHKLYRGIEVKHMNRIRHSMTAFSALKQSVLEQNAAKLMTKFLIATQRLDNLKRMTIFSVAKCTQM